MPFAINHIHLKADDPKRSADWWVEAFNFTILSDEVRARGNRFIACESENGIRVNISGAREGEPLGPGDASVHAGLEHFGLDSTDLEADIERLTALGAEQRTESLASAAAPDQAANLRTGLKRLIAADGMGTLFKVMALTGADAPPPAGFETTGMILSE